MSIKNVPNFLILLRLLLKREIIGCKVKIANNDSMAIGAVEALQKYGYNMGNKEKTIQVFGINNIQEAQELIKKY